MDLFLAPPDHALCIAETCVGFPQPSELSLCVMGPVYTCLGPPGPPSESQGFCAFVSAPRALPLHHGACMHLPQVLMSSFCATGLVCTSFISPAHPLFRRACVHLSQSLGPPSVSWDLCSLVLIPRPILYVPGFVCTSFTSPVCGLHQGACVHLSRLPWSAFSFAGFVFTFVRSMCLPSVLQGLCSLLSVCLPSMLQGLCVLVLSHQSALFVVGFMCSSFGSPGLPSVPRGLCALPKFVCLLSLGTPVPLCAMRVVCIPGVCMPCHTRLPGPALCAARVVCAGWVSIPPQSQFPETTIWLGPQFVSC